jgi:hypothetical protein
MLDTSGYQTPHVYMRPRQARIGPAAQRSHGTAEAATLTRQLVLDSLNSQTRSLHLNSNSPALLCFNLFFEAVCHKVGRIRDPRGDPTYGSTVTGCSWRGSKTALKLTCTWRRSQIIRMPSTG